MWLCFRFLKNPFKRKSRERELRSVGPDSKPEVDQIKHSCLRRWPRARDYHGSRHGRRPRHNPSSNAFSKRSAHASITTNHSTFARRKPLNWSSITREFNFVTLIKSNPHIHQKDHKKVVRAQRESRCWRIETHSPSFEEICTLSEKVNVSSRICMWALSLLMVNRRFKTFVCTPAI